MYILMCAIISSNTHRPIPQNLRRRGIIPPTRKPVRLIVRFFGMRDFCRNGVWDVLEIWVRGGLIGIFLGGGV